MKDIEHYPLQSMHEYLRNEFQSLGFKVFDLRIAGHEMYQKHGNAIINDPIHFSPLGAHLFGDYLAKDVQALQSYEKT